MTDDGFGALMCKKCVQSHRFGLGRGWVGGGDTIGGRGEPRSGIKNMYIGVCVCVCGGFALGYGANSWFCLRGHHSGSSHSGLESGVWACRAGLLLLL